MIDCCLSTRGKIEVTETTVKVLLCEDFSNYYKALAGRETWIKFSKPLYPPHLSLILPKFRVITEKEFIEYKKLDGEAIKVYYDPNIYFGGQNKGFLAIYMYFYRLRLKNVFNLDSPFFHCTLGTLKKHKQEDFTSWPKIVTIK